LTAQGSPAREPRRLEFASNPFGVLIARPADCTVGSSPAVTYTAADELPLDSLGHAVAEKFRLRAGTRARTYGFKLHRSSGCSQPPQSPAETDACTTTYLARGSLRVRPL
jgi:hypothetical protein